MTDTAIMPETATPIVKAVDIAYIRFSAPDLDAMERFVNDFGLVVVHRDDEVLISRGLEPMPFLHVVHRGPAKFMGWAFEVESEGDLDALADAVPGCSPVHDIGGVEGELGGGKRVHFVEPITGFVLEAVHGQQAEPLAPRRDRITYNHAGVDDRVGVEQDVSGNRYPIKKGPRSARGVSARSRGGGRAARSAPGLHAVPRKHLRHARQRRSPDDHPAGGRRALPAAARGAHQVDGLRCDVPVHADGPGRG